MTYQGVGDKDWLYLKIYSGKGDDVGRLLPCVRDWMLGLSGVQCWHFLRFVDPQGYHLRVRLRGQIDDVDAWYDDIPTLEALIRMIPARNIDCMIPDPMTVSSGTRLGVAVATYSPELAKYGGEEGMAAAEAQFAVSSDSCVANMVWQWSVTERLAAGMDYVSAVAREMGTAPEDLCLGIAQRWSGRVQASGIDHGKMAKQLPRIMDRVGTAHLPDALWVTPAAGAAQLVRDLGPAAGPNLVLDVIHMHINRIGLNPLEEYLVTQLVTRQSSGCR